MDHLSGLPTSGVASSDVSPQKSAHIISNQNVNIQVTHLLSNSSFIVRVQKISIPTPRHGYFLEPHIISKMLNM